MLIKTERPDRRRVLRGFVHGGAVAVSLPFLDAFLNENGSALAATGAPLPSRFGTWFWGLGWDAQACTPKTVGAYETPEGLKALEKVKQHVNVYTNFNVLTDGKPNLCHYSGWVGLRCGAAPAARGMLPGPSLDVTIADAVGAGTRFRSLNMAATGGARDSFSFRSAEAVNPPEISAVELYKKVFGAEFADPNSPNFTPDPKILTRKSVLSGIREESQALASELGAADRVRLDEYFTSIRALESRLELQLQKPPPAPNCKVPTEGPADMPIGVDVEQVSARHRAMTDLLVMALVCNQTKVFNMAYSDGGSSLLRKGLEKTHHIITHEEPIDPARGVQIEHVWFLGKAFAELGYFIEAMANTREVDGTLLDRMLIFAHSESSFAKAHTINGVPMFTAGNLGGKVKTGLHVDGQGEAGTRVGYTLQLLMGVPIGGWGQQSMATSRELGEIIA